MIEAIMFDLDGTLIQSEKLKAQAYAVAAPHHGKPGTGAEASHFGGRLWRFGGRRGADRDAHGHL